MTPLKVGGKFLHHHLRTKVGPVSCLGVRKKSKRWIGGLNHTTLELESLTGKRVESECLHE